MAGAYAFFDFDHTIIDADAGPRFGFHLLRVQRDQLREMHGPITGTFRRIGRAARLTPFMAWMATQAMMYKVRARRRSAIVRSAYRGLKGVPSEQFQAELQAFVAAELPELVFPDMVAEMKAHHKAGRRCVVITTGMEPLVELALPLLPKGVEVLGCRIDEKDGKLTGRVEGPLYGADKANIIHAYCRAGGVNPDDCYAYSDHWSDREMLMAVGHPVAVNPRGSMRKLAEQEGWRIMEPVRAERAR